MGFDDEQIKLVIAIDFGTSRSGYAYAFKRDKSKIVGRTEWDKQPFAYIKTLTQSLYNSDRKLESWGYSAMSRLAELRQNKSATDYTFFSTFKMALYNNSQRDENGEIVIIRNDKKFVVIDLVADYLRELKNLALEDLSKATKNVLKPNEVLWCLTIPAIWKDAEKSFMRRAAEKAGLVSSNESDRERLLLVLEPEAAAVYCQEKYESELNVGNRFMVVDCGGGTVDITVHEVLKDKRIKEVVTGTGGAFGSTYVDEQFFKEFLKNKLTAEALTHYEEEDPIGYLELLANWERKKCDFDPEKTEVTYFDIPTRLYMILSRSYPQVLQKLKTQQNDDEKVHVSREEMIKIFTPVLDGLINTVEKQFTILRQQQENCDFMYLVGGFSTSPMLRQRINNQFKDRTKIIMPLIPGGVIVEGAVSFGFNPQIIRSRRTRFTYGCDICYPFDEEKDRTQKSKRIKLEELDVWILRNRFHIFVMANESVEEDEVITHTFSPLNKDQRGMSFTFYAAQLKEPRYVDENGVEKIGELIIDLSSTVGSLDRPVEVSMSFGKTEIIVNAKDIKTGKTYDTKLQFSTTYSAESN